MNKMLEELKEGDYVVSVVDLVSIPRDWIFQLSSNLIERGCNLRINAIGIANWIYEKDCFRPATKSEAILYQSHGKPIKSDEFELIKCQITLEIRENI